jgi:CRISPR-associated protein Cas1
LYVREQNTEVRLKAGRLLVRKEEETRADLPLQQVRQIVLFGSVGLSPAVISHCLRENVDVCYLTMQGRYKGRLCGEGGRVARLRLDQYRQCSDPDFTHRVAQAIVAGKIRNQATFLARRSVAATDERKRLAELRTRALRARKTDTLRGLEGTAAQCYFQWIAQSLPAELGFTGNRDRPARDPINAALNLGYTLLYQQMVGTLHLVGLDPYLACLHQPHRDHAALASDLIEEFRAVIVDSLVFGMAGRRELRSEQFRTTANGETRFQEDALAHFLARFEERIDTATLYPPQKARFPYRRILEWQARHFAQLVQGECDAYRPVSWDY